MPIDYLAKDFASFRQALSEFSTLRYPAWVERSEADLGVMLMEALAAMADELSYYQDRVAAESTLETATQRLSAARHARLVDYEPAPAIAATTVLQLDVASPPPQATGWTIDTPLLVRALGADGSVTDFEIEDPADRAGQPGAPSPWTPAGTGAAWCPTSGTTASTAWPRARPTSTSSATASGSTRASNCCSTRPPPTAPIPRSASWSRSPRPRRRSTCSSAWTPRRPSR